MDAGTEHYEWVERPDADQMLFPSSRRTSAYLAGILVLAVIVVVWLYRTPGSPLHGLHGMARFGFILFTLLLMALAGWNLYLAMVGRSFLIDGKAKLVTRNGERVAGFGAVRSVQVRFGYHPVIFPAGRSYALCLQLKSGDSVALAGLRWMNWAEFFSSSEDQAPNNEAAADELEALAAEAAQLIGVPLVKSGR